MLYEVAYEGEKRFVRAETDDEALQKFRDDWQAYGDTPPASIWIEARWTEES